MRPFVQGHIDIDEYSATQTNLCYPTLSLYLDSDDLATYWWTINGNKNRFKLRLRYYDEQPNSPVFFDPNLVLELKFTDRSPNWFRDLVEAFNCMQMGAAKFAEGIYTRGESWIHRACPRKPPEQLIDDFLAGKGFPKSAAEAMPLSTSQLSRDSQTSPPQVRVPITFPNPRRLKPSAKAPADRLGFATGPRAGKPKAWQHR